MSGSVTTSGREWRICEWSERVPKDNSGSQFFYVPSGSFKACIHMFWNTHRLHSESGQTFTPHTDTPFITLTKLYTDFFSPTLTCINFLTCDTRYPAEKETGDFNICINISVSMRKEKPEQHNNEDSCLIPWFMR